MKFLSKPEQQPGASAAEPKQAVNVLKATDNVFAQIIKWIWLLRKPVLAAPVIFAALRLAAYNTTHLPDSVGLNLQANGTFTVHILKSMAVTGPLALTIGCLCMMFLSRKALYAWSISVFTLALPVLLLISNVYPA